VSRKVAKRTRAKDDLLFGKVPVKAAELEENRHDRSFFLCDLASLREMKMCHAKTQRRKDAKRTRAMDDLLAGKVFIEATELDEISHDRSFFLCVFASLREKKPMCHAKAQSR